MRGVGVQRRNFFRCQSAQHFSGRTDNQRIIRDGCAFGDQRVGTNQTIIPDDDVVEDDAVDADQAVITYGATMHHSQMADRDAVAYGQWCAGVGVQHGPVLNIGAVANADWFVIAAYYCAEPNADVVVHDDRADDAGAGRDEMALAVQYRGMAL